MKVNRILFVKCGERQEVYDQLKDTGLALLFKERCGNLQCGMLGEGTVHLHEGSGLGWADEKGGWSMPGLKIEEKGVKVTAEQKVFLNWPECWRKIHRVCLRHKTWALKSKRG